MKKNALKDGKRVFIFNVYLPLAAKSKLQGQANQH